MRYIWLLFFVFALATSHAQIVNVESRRIQSDTTGWLGDFGVSFELTKNTVQVLKLSTTAQLEYKAPKSLYLFLVNYDLLKGASQTLQNNVFFHIRYNYKISQLVRWEAFTQLQENNLSGIKSRWLLGTGPRFKISGSKKLALYAASLVMYENERELTKPVVNHHDFRSSNYVSISWRPADRSEIVTTVFYQPLFRDLADYRFLHELKLKFDFTKKFSFFTTWSFLYDSRPPAGVPDNTFSLKNGIEYEF